MTTSSISYFYWVEEQLHEQEVFTKMNADELKEEAEHDKTNYIKLILTKKDQLPEGYSWEEEGREFSHKGMFYDIFSIKKTNKGWELVAVSDEEEAAIVANQNNSKKEGYHFKLSSIQLIFIAPSITQQTVYFNIILSNYATYKACLYYRSLIKFSPPPEAICF